VSNVVNRAGVRLLRPRTLFGLFMAGPALKSRIRVLYDQIPMITIIRQQHIFLYKIGMQIIYLAIICLPSKNIHSRPRPVYPAPAVLMSLIPYTVNFFDPPPKLPRITTTFEPVIGLTYSTTTALGLGGRQRAVRPVDLKSRSIRGEVVELAFTRVQRTL
jgi:hypothetical protein